MSDDFLGVAGKRFLIFGVANRKSVATHIARLLAAAGARLVYVVRSQERKEAVGKLLATISPEPEIHVCDVECADQIAAVRTQSLRSLVALTRAGMAAPVGWSAKASAAAVRTQSS